MKKELELLSNNEMTVSGTEVPFLYFRRFSEHPEVKHGCSTRVGGVSKGAFSSMNLGFGRGDADENVLENYDRICKAIGFTKEQVVLPDQVHETVVRRATKADCGKGIVKMRDYSCVDAQITNEPGVALAVFGADCVPVFFYDPVKKAIGTAHAGWRGTIGRIAEKTVEAMVKAFGSKPEDIEAYIGVSICGDCYTVGGEVAERFLAEFPEAMKEVTADGKNVGIKENAEKPSDREKKDRAEEAEQKKNTLWKLNLWKVNQMILEEAGVKPENIVISGVCTKCHSELLFSHRVAGNERGSLVGFLMLAEE